MVSDSIPGCLDLRDIIYERIITRDIGIPLRDEEEKYPRCGKKILSFLN